MDGSTGEALTRASQRPRYTAQTEAGADASWLTTVDALLQQSVNPMVLIGSDGQVLLENRAAARLVASGRCPVERRGLALIISHQGKVIDARLLEAFARAATSCAGTPSASVVVRLDGARSSKPTFLEAHRLQLPTRRPVWTLSIHQPIDGHQLSVQTLRTALGLTASECLLAQALFSGLRLADAAAALQITRETAKKHLASVFRKCDVQTQAELLQLLAMGPFRISMAGGHRQY